ncbi:MAG: ABC transporter substrate-binding protein [Candidatus Lambdaproteobacteria bacterium]|nr:ABC transporter substrate-binding protein [Candidatus Lambdaproteobacteria bacterium]
MTHRRTMLAGMLGVVFALVFIAGPVAAQNDQFFPLLVYRTGPYAPNGIPSANGFRDYYDMVNKRDGGVNGVKISWEECETSYDTKRGVECYEKLKARATVVHPFSTGITYQLIPKAAVDQVPLWSSGYGRTATADGTVFPWAFNAPTTYWAQASAVINYIAQQEGGMDKLKGKKIAHVYHNSPYGKEANPTLEVLAQKFGYELTLLAVDHPGQEQKATWLQIRRLRPDYIYMSSWGVMGQVAVKEAAAISFPMDHFIGNWWSASEAEVVPAGSAANGYKGATFNGAGPNWPVHQDILKHVYNGDQAKAKENNWGEVLYNRTLVGAMANLEAVRVAQKRYGNRVITGAEMRWGMDNLDITAARIKELGFDGMMRPLRITCADHEGSGPVLIQQWDGAKWNPVSDWIPVMRDVVRPMIEQSAMEYAKENNITPRKCE